MKSAISHWDRLQPGADRRRVITTGVLSEVLLPWDHALMTYYELYSMEMPLLLPAKEWMLRWPDCSCGAPCAASCLFRRMIVLR